METLATLPVWAQILLALLAAGILVLLNLGWLLQARGMLDNMKKKRGGAQPPSKASLGRWAPAARVDRGAEVAESEERRA